MFVATMATGFELSSASARKPIAAGAAWIVTAAFFGGVMYLITYRRFLTEAVRDARVG
jgi:hypothetical protein